MNNDTLRRLQDEAQRQLTEAARRRVAWLAAFRAAQTPHRFSLTDKDRQMLREHHDLIASGDVHGDR